MAEFQSSYQEAAAALKQPRLQAGFVKLGEKQAGARFLAVPFLVLRFGLFEYLVRTRG